MRKQNVMIEVDDDVYNDVVEPFKKRKAFGKLVTTLLQAYYDNEGVYGYINGVLDGVEDESNNELLKDLNNMAMSLSMLGSLQNEAEASIDSGQRAFDDFGQKAMNDMKSPKFTKEPEEKPKSGSGGVTREEVESIVGESMSKIENMLRDLMLFGIRTPAEGNVTSSEPKEVTVEDIKVTKKQPEPVKIDEEVERASVSDEDFLGYMDDDFGMDEDNESSGSEEDRAALESLLGSLNF